MPSDTTPEGRELVFVLHGLGRTRISMALLAMAMERAGFRVANWGYPSATGSIPAFGQALADEVALQARDAPRIHFVGHSLGNIVVRWMLANAPPPRPGRVVMLAPPNQGSRAADRFAPWLSWFLRPLTELRTDSESTVRTLIDAPGVEIGIIAGSRDRKVSVDEAHLPGATETIVLPTAHTVLMNRPDVHRLVARFLREGTFGGAADGGSLSLPKPCARADGSL
jgi:pimeloyl-ACP methyl ester carboxylesterase